MVPKYLLQCPHCPAHTPQHETNLAEIVQYRGASTTGAPWITLVCPQCSSAFRFDWMNRRTSPWAVLTDEPPLATAMNRFCVVTGCVDNNCESRTELVALRPHGATKEQCLAEMNAWTVDGILCEHGHQIVVPSSAAVREWLEKP
jgi:hypothetical protein